MNLIESKFSLLFPNMDPLDFKLRNKDPFTNKTFGELIQSQMERNLPYILAVIQDFGCTNPFYFDALNLRQWSNENLTNPVTDQKLNRIFYFTLTKPQIDSFKYLGDSDEVNSRGDFINAFFGAAVNDVQSMCDLGSYYLDGCGIEKNLEEAFKWLNSSAEKGNSEAQFHLGQYYCFEKKDPEKAFHYYKLSAEQGYVYGQSRLGVLYYEGLGVQYNYNEARKLWKLALEQDENIAILLGFKDYAKEFLNEEEKQKLFLMARNNYGIYNDASLSDEQNLELQKIILSALNGDTDAQFNLGCYCYDATLFFEHTKMAFQWWALAAEQGHADSLSNLIAMMHECGVLQYELAVHHYEGKMIQQNIEKAIKCWKVSGKQGNSDSQYIVGVCYAQGYGINQNLKKARKWLTRSADRGDLDASEYLTQLL